MKAQPKDYATEAYPPPDPLVSTRKSFSDVGELVKLKSEQDQRRDRSDALAIAIGKYVAAYIARNVHMSGKNGTLDVAMNELAETIYSVIE